MTPLAQAASPNMSPDHAPAPTTESATTRSTSGTVTLRRASKLLHIGIGPTHVGTTGSLRRQAVARLIFGCRGKRHPNRGLRFGFRELPDGRA